MPLLFNASFIWKIFFLSLEITDASETPEEFKSRSRSATATATAAAESTRAGANPPHRVTNSHTAQQHRADAQTRHAIGHHDGPINDVVVQVPVLQRAVSNSPRTPTTRGNP